MPFQLSKLSRLIERSRNAKVIITSRNGAGKAKESLCLLLVAFLGKLECRRNLGMTEVGWEESA